MLILPIVLSFSLSLLRSSNSQTFSNSRTLKLSVLYRSDSATPELKTDTDESGDEISNMGHDRLVRRSNFDKVGGVVVYHRSSSSCGSSSSSMIFIFIADLHRRSVLGLVVVWFFFFFSCRGLLLSHRGCCRWSGGGGGCGWPKGFCGWLFLVGSDWIVHWLICGVFLVGCIILL